jgi:N-acetylneuraminic acid mutarotase
MYTVHLEGGPRRVNHAAVSIGGSVYSFGGYCTGENYNESRPIDVHALNTHNYRWRLVLLSDDTVCPFQRYGHTVVAHDGRVYLWGGRNDRTACHTLYCFDPGTIPTTPKKLIIKLHS